MRENEMGAAGAVLDEPIASPRPTPVCHICGHVRDAHSDDKAPQWERPCWFLTNGRVCPCTGYVSVTA